MDNGLNNSNNNNNNNFKPKAPLIIIIAIFIIVFGIFKIILFLGVFIMSDKSNFINQMKIEKPMETKAPEMREEKYGDNVYSFNVATKNLESMEFDLISTNIVFIQDETDNDDIIVEWYSNIDKDSQKTSINLVSDKLIIEETFTNKLKFFNGIGNEKSIITIYLPKTQVDLDNISIKTVSGGLDDESITNLSVEAFKWDSISSDLSINNIKSEKINTSSVSGNINVDNKDIEELKAKTVSGNMEFNLNSVEEVDINTISGNTEINFNDDLKYNIKYNTVSGSTDISQDKLNQESDREINISSVSGNIFIK